MKKVIKLITLNLIQHKMRVEISICKGRSKTAVNKVDQSQFIALLSWMDMILENKLRIKWQLMQAQSRIITLL